MICKQLRLRVGTKEKDTFWYLSLLLSCLQEVEAYTPLRGKSPTRHQKQSHPLGVALFLVQHFCFAKVVACGRVTERERGNPLRFPPLTLPLPCDRQG